MYCRFYNNKTRSGLAIFTRHKCETCEVPLCKLETSERMCFKEYHDTLIKTQGADKPDKSSQVFRHGKYTAEWIIKGFVRHEHPTVYILVVIGIVSKLHPIEVLTFNSRRNLNMCDDLLRPVPIRIRKVCKYWSFRHCWAISEVAGVVCKLNCKIAWKAAYNVPR
jgi:hypothetical protein